MRRYSILIFGLPAAAGLLAGFSYALADIPAPAKLSKNAPVLVDADDMGYDQKNALVIATGNVEVYQGDYILLASRIVYNQNTNIVRAEGNVSVLEPEGSVYFAQNVELKDDLREGVIDNFRARLSDNSLFAAREARKINENVTVMKKAVYSPCKICAGDESKAPMWQIKGDEVIYDTKEQRVTYHSAFFEAYGVPILYTPYFSHATPGADNKSGFLEPEYNHSTNLGTVLRIPYLFSIAPDKDITFTPIYTQQEGPVLGLHYRQKTDDGSFEFKGNATNPDKRDALGNIVAGHEFRGNIKGKGNFWVTPAIDWGFDVNRASDDTFLRFYDISYEDRLTSRLFAQRIQDRNYAIVQGLSFQSLRAGDDQDAIPLVAPYGHLYYETGPGWNHSRFSLSGDAMALSRQTGADSRRASFTGAWKVPYIASNGQLLEASASLRTDAYSVNSVLTGLPGSPRFSGTQGRVIPEISGEWRYPFVRPMENGSIVLEPTVKITASTLGGNTRKIPNEDSVAAEFTDSNLFAADRFPGLDRVETGLRTAYGVRGQVQFMDNNDLRFLLGQHYGLDEDNPFPLARAPGKRFSDYVGSASLNYAPVDLSYRFRLDKETLALTRSEVNALYSWQPFSLAVDYISLDRSFFIENLEEIQANSSLALNEQWTLALNTRHDLTNRGGTVGSGGSLIFQNECLTLTTGLNRTLIRDRDVKPSTSLSIRVGLKNLE